MPKSNIEVSNIWIGYIFAKLYESFPMPYDLTVSEILRETNERPNLDDYQISMFGNSLIDWLKAEGYIRGEDPPLGPDFLIDCATLTERGLGVLNAVPGNLANTKKLGEQLVDASKDIAQDSAKKLVGDLVSKIFGAVIKVAVS